VNDGPVYPSVGQAIGLVLVLLAAQVALGMFLGAMASAFGLAPRPGDPGLVGLGLVISTAIVLLGACKLKGLDPARVFRLTPFRIVLLPAIVLVVAGLGIVASEIDNVTRRFLPAPDSLVAMFRELGQGGFASIAAVAIIGPATEELVFRGMVLRGFLSRYSPAKAVLLSALLFSLVHLNPYQFVSAFAAGLFLAWLFLLTRSLWPCIVAHALGNATGFVVRDLLKLEVRGYTGSVQGPVEFQPLWFDAMGLALLGVGVLLLIAFSRGRGDTPHAE